MKLAHFTSERSSVQRLGILIGQRVVDVAALASSLAHAGEERVRWLSVVGDIADVIRGRDESLAQIHGLVELARSRGIVEEGEPLEAVTFLPPVYPSKIVAIGRNYVDHAIEGGDAPPAVPLIFTKLPNSLSSHNAPIVLPVISSQVDYEAELAVVIGQRASRVSEADALNHVFGYTLINDVSARDLQFGDGQWVRGKGLDGFAPLGPFITTRDEIADVHDLNIEGRLNGEVMQSSNTGKMIFKIPYLISYISQAITLEPGDVIATGTPEGVGIFRNPPIVLKPGDVFEVTVESLGTLRNPVVGPE